MTKLEWGRLGERLYELGVDRGVLFVPGHDGVAWNGLVAVTETPSSSGVRQSFLDGIVYHTEAPRDLYSYQIEALYSPPEFDECDGVEQVFDGVFASEQLRKPFGFSYRSLVGNSIEGEAHGYKVHLVYNSLATPANRAHKTIEGDPDLEPLAWEVSTTPEQIPMGDRATYSAHLFFETGKTPAWELRKVENILYGTDSSAPRLPLPSELYSIFYLVIIDGNEDGEELRIYDGGTADTTYDSWVDGGSL